MKKIITDIINLVQDKVNQAGKTAANNLQPIPVVNKSVWQK
jgi:hypothetical protein